MNCNQCEFIYINGVGCHETGCPNIKKIKECFKCGFEVLEGTENCGCSEENI